MACVFVCDNCDKREPGEFMHGGWYKPAAWYQRSDEQGPQIACSLSCISAIAAKTGKTAVVIPI